MKMPIPLVTNTKFLGVTIDNNLTWTKHINNVITKISANKNLIGRSRNLLSTHAKNLFTMHTFTLIWLMQSQYGEIQ